jgi:hypothetical protein
LRTRRITRSWCTTHRCAGCHLGSTAAAHANITGGNFAERGGAGKASGPHWPSQLRALDWLHRWVGGIPTSAVLPPEAPACAAHSQQIPTKPMQHVVSYVSTLQSSSAHTSYCYCTTTKRSMQPPEKSEMRFLCAASGSWLLASAAADSTVKIWEWREWRDGTSSQSVPWACLTTLQVCHPCWTAAHSAAAPPVSHLLPVLVPTFCARGPPRPYRQAHECRSCVPLDEAFVHSVVHVQTRNLSPRCCFGIA